MPQIQVNSELQIDKKNADALIRHAVARLQLSTQMRDRLLETYRYIDREYYGWLLRDADDEKRKQENIRGTGVKPTDEKLSMMFAQLDEAVTYLLSVLAPDEAIYAAVAPKEQQQVADGFAALMNQHAEAFGHYRNYNMFLLDALRYNLACFVVNWKVRNGVVISQDLAGVPQPTKTVAQDGNEIFTLDPYNVFLDPSISPVDMPEQGEWFGWVDVMTPFRLKKMQQDGDLFNVDDFVNSTQPRTRFFAEHPEIRNDVGRIDNAVNWVDVLRAVPHAEDSQSGYEMLPLYLWLIPSEFGLSDSEEYEIWRIILGSDTHLLHAAKMENLHGMLPINIAVPFEDHFAMQSKAVSERLIPHQRFASFVMNTHQRATRKRLYGLTIYNQNVIPLMDQDDVDLEGGKIPASTTGQQDIDLRKHIVQFNDGPDTTNTLQNIEVMSSIMQGVLPTNILRQVAGLERATQYQAAALVQGANRRNLKIAKIINSQAMDRGRRMQMYNIQQFQTQVEILDEQGSLIQIDPKEFLDTRIEFKMSDGLKGLDRLALQINMKELIAMVLQSQQASAQTDIMALINYLSTLFGDYTDFNQFKIQSPIDALPPEQRNLAFQLLQAAQQQAAEGQGQGQGGQQRVTPI